MENNCKSNMYSSIHSTVFGPNGMIVQVQIRTPEMDKVASFGLASYWDFLKGGAKKAMQQEISKLPFYHSLEEIAMLTDDNDIFFEQVNSELLAPLIHVRRDSDGSLVELHEGATPVDFAYKLGEDVGNKIVAAVVNGKYVSLDYKLQDEDIVHVIVDAMAYGSRGDLVNVTASDALKHPTWKMGQKITIDSATMVNKAFEIIEAGYLFDYPYSKIKVMLHDESYLHSYVSLKSGGYRGEISKPDMRNPIKFALYQGNIPFKTSYFASLDDLKGLHFHSFSMSRYPAIRFAEMVLNKKGTLGAVFNRSNEEAVYAFLRGEIGFLDIEKIISLALKAIPYKAHPTLEEIIEADSLAKEYVSNLIRKAGGLA